MKIGLMDYRQITNDYHQIDTKFIDGDCWVLYEHNWDGDEVKCIAVNLTKKFYTYTWESLEYTVEYLEEEFELYKL